MKGDNLKTKTGIEMRAEAAARATAAADPAEQARRALANCERVIESARQSFLDMGRALLEIRTGKLYEADGFVAFDEYVLDRWEITARQANRLIVSHRIDLILGPIGLKLQSEAAARELIPIADDEPALVAVYEEAVRRAGGGRVTAVLVAAARDALTPPVIEGELGQPAKDPLAQIPAAEAAVNEFLNNQTSGSGDASPAAGSGDSTPADPPNPPDAVGEGQGTEPRTGADVGQPEQDQDAAERDVNALGEAADSQGSGSAETGSEGSAPEAPSGPVTPREQGGAGVSRPAPASKREETEDEQATREEREYREARSLEFASGLVNVRMRLEPDPVRWYQDVYVHGLYHARDLPRVRDSFTPVGLRQAAGFLLELADHLEKAGEEL